MAPATSPQPDPPPTATSPGSNAATAARRAWLGDNPMQTVLAAAVVGLLIFSLTSNSSRIARLEDAVNAGFAAQDAKIEARFTQIDARFTQIDARFTQIDNRFVQIDNRFAQIEARFDELEARIDRLELKLTALIAALNKTDEVDAAIEGRLLGPVAEESSP